MWVNSNESVLTGNAVIIWNGLTKPDTVKSEKGDYLSWNLRVAMPSHAPEFAELEALRQKGLRESNKKEVSVASPGNNPVSDIDLAKFPELQGHKAFSASTTTGAPEVYDAHGNILSPMEYGPMIYNGCIVRLMVNSYAYANKQKGINFGVQGVQIIDATAPRLSIGASGPASEVVRSAFMTAPSAAAPSAPPAPGQSAAFPPAGWAAHPTSPGYFFCGQEVLTEAELRAKFAPPAAPTAPPAPPSPPPAPAAPTPPPAPHTSYMDPGAPPAPAAFPPVGWWAHPGVPGSFYNAQNEVLTEAQLRARG